MRLKRADLQEELDKTNIFTNPAIYKRGGFWAIAYEDLNIPWGRGSVTIGRNIDHAIEWLKVAEKAGAKLPRNNVYSAAAKC